MVLPQDVEDWGQTFSDVALEVIPYPGFAPVAELFDRCDLAVVGKIDAGTEMLVGRHEVTFHGFRRRYPFCY